MSNFKVCDPVVEGSCSVLLVRNFVTVAISLVLSSRSLPSPSAFAEKVYQEVEKLLETQARRYHLFNRAILDL